MGGAVVACLGCVGGVGWCCLCCWCCRCCWVGTAARCTKSFVKYFSCRLCIDCNDATRMELACLKRLANTLNRGFRECPNKFCQCLVVVEFKDCFDDCTFNVFNLVSASFNRRPIKVISSTTRLSLESKAPPLEVKSCSRLSINSEVLDKDVEMSTACLNNRDVLGLLVGF